MKSTVPVGSAEPCVGVSLTVAVNVTSSSWLDGLMFETRTGRRIEQIDQRDGLIGWPTDRWIVGQDVNATVRCDSSLILNPWRTEQ